MPIVNTLPKSNLRETVVYRLDPSSIRAYESWWDASLIDERNEQPLHAAFVAAVAVWAAAFLLTLA